MENISLQELANSVRERRMQDYWSDIAEVLRREMNIELKDEDDNDSEKKNYKG